MLSWIDTEKILPGLKGQYFHAANIEIETLKKHLINFGFQIYSIDGIKISNEETFFDEVACVFNFPTYFGKNWGAWDECFGDFITSLSVKRVAIIWEHVENLISKDILVFLQASYDLFNYAMMVSGGLIQYNPQNKTDIKNEPIQMEIFLISSSEGFTKISEGEQ